MAFNHSSGGDYRHRCVSAVGYLAGSWPPLKFACCANTIDNIYRVLERGPS